MLHTLIALTHHFHIAHIHIGHARAHVGIIKPWRYEWHTAEVTVCPNSKRGYCVSRW